MVAILRLEHEAHRVNSGVQLVIPIIAPVPGGFTLVDLASTNGTKVNGRIVGEHVLQNGDEVLFGETVIRFEND